MNSGLPMGAALWLGIQTAVCPCLLATTVAAIAFIARRVDRPRQVLFSGLCYMAGQTLAYVLLAGLLVSSMLSVPLVSLWLQQYMTRLLGPILLLVAVLLLEWIAFPAFGGGLKQWAQARASTGGLSAAFLLGIVFALSFCPVTAALFFGVLIPLAVVHESMVLLPLAYALGVAIPVLIFALIIAFCAHRVGVVFARVRQVEGWARRAAGAVFLLIGLYFTCFFTFGHG